MTVTRVRAASFTGDVEELDRLRGFVRTLCTDLPEREVRHLELALDEAFCNVVHHSYGGKGGAVLLKGEITDEGFCFELSDQGKSFDFEAVPLPDWSGNRVGGFGLHIIRQVADEVTYRQEAGWNRLRIMKRCAHGH